MSAKGVPLATAVVGIWIIVWGIAGLMLLARYRWG